MYVPRAGRCPTAHRAPANVPCILRQSTPRTSLRARALDGRPNQQAYMSGLPTIPDAEDPQQQLQQQQQQQQQQAAGTSAAAAPHPAHTPQSATASAGASTSPAALAPAAPVEPAPPSWESWCTHFEEQDAAGTELDALQAQLQRAVQLEEYTTAATLKQQLQQLAAADAVATLREQLSQALLNEDYATAQAVAEQGATWLEGWWVGRSDSQVPGLHAHDGPSPDPFGHLLHVTAEYGRWTGRLYSPRDLAELSGWADGSNTQVLLRFGRTAASAMPGVGARLRAGGPSAAPAAADPPSLQSMGCPAMELFVKAAPGTEDTASSSSASAATAAAQQQQAVRLQSRQEIERLAAEAAPRALLQQLAREANPDMEGGPRSSRRQRRAGSVAFWFDFGQQGAPTDVQVVEVGMLAQNLGVYKRTVVLPPPGVDQLMQQPQRAQSPEPNELEQQHREQAVPDSAADTENGLGDNPSLRHLRGFELQEVLETLAQLRDDSTESPGTSSADEDAPNNWVVASRAELGNLSNLRNTNNTSSSSNSRQPTVAPLHQLYGRSSDLGPSGTSSNSMGELANSSSTGSSSNRPGSAGLYRLALGSTDDVDGSLAAAVELQRLPAVITRLGKDTFQLADDPSAAHDAAGSPGSGSSSSSPVSRVELSPESRYSSCSTSEDPSVPRCVVLHVPVSRVAALAAAQEVSWGSSGGGGVTSSSRSLEAELAAHLGEMDAGKDGGSSSSSGLRDGSDLLSGSGVMQLGREVASERAVWERAAREVVARQVELSGRPLPAACVSQLAGALQLHGDLLAASGLLVAPGAPVNVDDVPADYRPEPSQATYQRLPLRQPRTDPFTGLYLGAFGPHGQELLQLQRQIDEDGDEAVVGIKLTGDVNVPAGAVSFRAKVGRRHRMAVKDAGYPEELGVTARYPGQGRVAQAGFRNPQWVEGELVVFGGYSASTWVIGDAPLGFLWAVPGERRFLILLHRIQLEDLK